MSSVGDRFDQCEERHDDGRPCELARGRSGNHAHRLADILCMMGVATTRYRIGTAWRSWSSEEKER